MTNPSPSQELEQRKKVIATTIASPIASVITKYACHPIDTIKSKIQAKSNSQTYQLGHSIEVGNHHNTQVSLYSDTGITILRYRYHYAQIQVQLQSHAGIATVKQVQIQVFSKGDIQEGRNCWFFQRSNAVCLWINRGIQCLYDCLLEAQAEFVEEERSKNATQFFQEHPALNHLVSGFMAEIVSSVFWLPIDIIKQRLQVQSQVKIFNYKGPRQAMEKIKQSEGIIGLYRVTMPQHQGISAITSRQISSHSGNKHPNQAFGATLVLFGPSSALFFVFYQQLKTLLVLQPKKPSLFQSIVCSAGAGALSGFITTPLQMVKLRMQIQRADRASKGGQFTQTLYGYRNVFHGLYTVVQKEGWLALYKGAGLRVLFTVPMFSFSIGLTESIRSFMLARGLVDSLV